jgi:hypothetical protein
MRVALILSGGVRNVVDTFESIDYHLLKNFLEIDVFIYACENVEGRDKNLEFLSKKFSPKKIIVNKKSFYTSDIGSGILSNKHFHHPSPSYWNNSIWAFYNVIKCNELKNQYEIENGFTYDLVVRSRMDIFWFRKIEPSEIEISKNNIVVPWDWAFRSGPPWNGRHNFGYADIYAFSSGNLFNFYANAYNHISNFSEIYPYAPESFLGYYLKDMFVVECKKHIMLEYPIIERNGLDGNGDKIPEPFFHPKIWNGMNDFGSTEVRHITSLRKRFD